MNHTFKTTPEYNLNTTASNYSDAKEIPHQMESLRGEVTALQSLAEALETRLQPVLHGGSPDFDSDTKTPSISCTLLGEEITNLRDTVRGISRGLHDIIERLEI